MTIFSALLALLLTAFYFAPLSLLLVNSRELSVSPSTVLELFWTIQLSLIIFAVSASFILGSRLRRVFACLLASVAVLLYLQGNIFVWNYGLFDGTDIDWGRHSGVAVIEVIFWLGLPILAIYHHRKIWPRVHMLAFTMILLQAAPLLIQLGTGKEFPASANDGRVTDSLQSFFEFSPDKNVLVIVADTLSAPIFEEVLEVVPLVKEGLAGFTYYSNTSGVSPYTLLSVPTMLSSRAYDSSTTIQDFMTDTLGENSLPSVLQGNGYKSSVITMGLYKRYLKWLPAENTVSVLDDDGESAELRASLQVWDVTLFRYLPHILKRQVYSEHKWLLQSLVLDGAGDKSVRNVRRNQVTPMMEPTSVHRASAVIHDRFIEQASANNDVPTFKFIHLFTAHTPYLMDTDGESLSKSDYQSRTLMRRAHDQTEFSLKQLLGFLEKLKSMDIYDQTMIIIAADHGAGSLGGSKPDHVSRALPTLLIKPFNSGASGLEISEAPVSLVDLPITVTGALNINTDFLGYEILGSDIPNERVRYYFDFKWDNGFWTADHLPLIEKYRINGSVRDLASWKKVCDIKYEDGELYSC
jgi:hypothetical protein